MKSVEIVLLSMDKEKFINAFKEKKCIVNLERYLKKKQLWRQDFITKQADFRDILDQSRASNTPSPKLHLQTQKSQEYFLSDNAVGTPTNFSSFRKNINLSAVDEPNVIRSPQYSRFKAVKIVVQKQKSASPSNNVMRFASRRLTEEAVSKPESKIFSEKFLKRISQTKLAEKSEKFRKEHANKLNLNKAIANKNKQADEMLQRKAASNKSLTSDHQDPYYNFAGLHKPNHQDHIENPFESYGIIDSNKPNTKTKPEDPVLKIKLMKSLGLDKVYQQDTSLPHLPLLEKIESDSYLHPNTALHLNLTTDRYRLKNSLLDDSEPFEKTPKTHKVIYDNSPMSATLSKSGGKSPRFLGLTILQKKLSTITTSNIK